MKNILLAVCGLSPQVITETLFALRKKACRKPPETCRGCTDCFIDIDGVYEGQKQINELYSKLAGNKPLGEMSDSGITNLSSDDCGGCFFVFLSKPFIPSFFQGMVNGLSDEATSFS